jgi:hypothetical protein
LLAASIAGAAAAALLPAGAGAVGAPQQREGRAPFVAAPQADRSSTAAARSLARRLGPEATVELSGISGTPRRVGRTDGTLTGASRQAPATIALDWVRDHPSLFKLDAGDLAALGTPKQVTTPSGIRIVSWAQQYRGIPVVGAGLRANVAAGGQLLSVSGGPLPDTSVAETTPTISAQQALSRARRDAGATGAAPQMKRSLSGPRRATVFRDDSTASLVVYPGRDRNRLAWSVTAKVDSTHIYSYLLDARSGAVLTRENMVRWASGGYVWSYAPSPAVARNDGDVQEFKEFGPDWLFDGVDWGLFGHNAWAYSDVDDDDSPFGADDLVDEGDQVRANDHDGTPDALPVWRYEYRPITTGGGCSALYPCSWDPSVPDSWRENREQNAVQAFWFVNTFAEHLRAAPIGFDEASGNFRFELNDDNKVVGDGVFVETSDGANTAGGRPDGNHRNNANMWTPVDGTSPAMQMYLFDEPIAGNGGDDAAIVYHEYTHGLSSRIVSDVGTRRGSLWQPQAGAMGEAWSDWYAMDFLVGSQAASQLPADDVDTPGEIVLAASLTRGENGLRESALDCPAGVAHAAPTCPGGGGFTFADYGKVWAGGPEVHADGEIWAQTLWDLRTELIRRYGPEDGVERARRLITDGMRMVTRSYLHNPTFIDARNAILEADVAWGRGAGSSEGEEPDHSLIWSVFARRGMGYFASTERIHGAYDPAPIADFQLPPDESVTGTLSGTVTDADTHTALPGVTVSLPGNTLSATTGADGRYTLTGVVATTYPRLVVTRAGYDAPSPNGAVDVDAGGTVHDFALRRNWALTTGGTQVLAGIDPDGLGEGCYPENALDGSLAYGWASYQPDWDGIDGDLDDWFPDSVRGPRAMTLWLPQDVDVSEFLLDPGAICGDDDSASLGEFTIETADASQQFRLAYDGRGDNRFVRAARPNHRLHTLTPIAGTTTGVRYVKVTMLRPQGEGSPGDSAERFVDLAEFGIHGTVTPERRGPEEEPRDPPRDPRDPPRDQPRRTDTRAPQFLLKPTVVPKKRALTALRSRAGLPIRFRLDETASVNVTATLPLATARKLGLTKARKGKTFRLRSVTVRSLRAKQTGTVRLKLPAAARRRLSRTKSLRITVTVEATDAARNTGRATVRPLLKR